jgi:hypothetical protein
VDEDVLPKPGLADVLLYRKVVIAVVATYLCLDDEFVDAVLCDRMDEYLQAEALPRERLKAEHYDEYLSLLGREIIVRYAATAAEGLARHPTSLLAQKRIMGDTGVLGLTDDVNAVVRVHEMFEFLESPEGGEEAERILTFVKRQLCNYYNACAYDLVTGNLLPAIIDAADELYRTGHLTAERTRALVIAAQP